MSGDIEVCGFSIVVHYLRQLESKCLVELVEHLLLAMFL